MDYRPPSLHPPRPEKKALEKRVFHNPDVLDAAKELLGLSLFTRIGGVLTGGIITETEAYAGVQDKASHAYGGRRTRRTEPMYQKGGIAYVYLCYGIHSLFNVVTGDAGVPHAVLIRSLHPTHGLDAMLQRRQKTRLDPTLACGPGALAAALGITVSLTGIPLDSETLWISDTGIRCLKWDATPRIGVGYTESDSKIGRWQGGARHLSQAEPALKQPNLKGLGDASGIKCRGCPTQPKPIFESRAVYAEEWAALPYRLIGTEFN